MSTFYSPPPRALFCEKRMREEDTLGNWHFAIYPSIVRSARTASHKVPQTYARSNKHFIFISRTYILPKHRNEIVVRSKYPSADRATPPAPHPSIHQPAASAASTHLQRVLRDWCLDLFYELSVLESRQTVGIRSLLPSSGRHVLSGESRSVVNGNSQ